MRCGSRIVAARWALIRPAQSTASKQCARARVLSLGEIMRSPRARAQAIHLSACVTAQFARLIVSRASERAAAVGELAAECACVRACFLASAQVLDQAAALDVVVPPATSRLRAHAAPSLDTDTRASDAIVVVVVAICRTAAALALTSRQLFCFNLPALRDKPRARPKLVHAAPQHAAAWAKSKQASERASIN